MEGGGGGGGARRVVVAHDLWYYAHILGGMI